MADIAIMGVDWSNPDWPNIWGIGVAVAITSRIKGNINHTLPKVLNYER